MTCPTRHAMISALILGLVGGMYASPALHAADKPAVENKAVAEALIEAKRLAEKRKWEPALAALRKAKAVEGKSRYASQKIDEFEAYVRTQQREYTKAAEVFERLAKSNDVQKEQLKQWQTASQLYLQAKAYDKAAHAAQQALKLSQDDPELLELLAQSQYLGKQYRPATDTLQTLVGVTEKRGKKPEEVWLQMLLASYNQLRDERKIAAAWESLLTHYPTPQYWETVLRMKAQRSASEALEAGYQRLMFDVGVLKKPADYENLALNAIDSGAPGEAVKVLQTGLENGSLGGQNEARYRRMLEFAEGKVKEREQNLSQLSANAASLPAEAQMKLGRLYLGRGDYEEAVQQLQRALEGHDVTNEEQARIALGIAYLKNEQPKRARETFGKVDAKSEWRDLAELWSLRANSAQKGAS